jgi:signal transduction histidine kinase
MITELVPVQFATIGLIDEKNPQRVLFNHIRPLASKDTSHQGWQVSLVERGALRLAYEQQRGLELLPGGVGARQVHELAQQFNTGPLGPVFVEPLMAGSNCLGFLVLAAPPSVPAWTDQERALVPSAAAFLAQAIANSRQLEEEIAARQTPAAETSEDRETAAELDRLNAELSDLRARLAEAEAAVRLVPPAVVATVAATADVSSPRPLPAPAGSAPADAETGTAVTPVIEEAITLVLPAIREKGLQLDLSLPAELPTVAVRREVLQQLVVSLLDNACRASVEDSSVLLRADLAAANGGSTSGAAGNKRVLRITVADGGVGIRPEDQERVFDSSYYLSGGQLIPGLGDSGANLAIVQKLAQASGGNISLKSSEGQGTAFALSLPITALYTGGAAAPAKPAPGSSTKLLRQPAESGS